MEVIESNTNALIDAVLSIAELNHYRRSASVKVDVLAVCASFETRALRLASRSSRNLNQLQLLQRDEIERTSLGTEQVISAAEYRIDNEGSIDEFHAELKRVLKL